MSGEVGVWCEHEAPTTAVASSKRIGGWLHTIDAASITAQRDPVNHLNSDPWIWAPGFAWCVCQQRSSGKVRPAVAAREQGDIVVFGSPVDNQWVMDTVFVCGIRHSSMATLRSAAPEAAVSLSKCVLAPLRGVRGLAPLQGQPFSPHGVFSFAPVSIGATPRKRVNVSGILRKLRKRDGEPPALNNAQGLTTCTYKGTPSELWHELVAATLRAKYALGVGFTHPLDAAPWGRG